MDKAAVEASNSLQTDDSGLIRGLSLFDAVLLAVGTMVGSAIFLTSGDIVQSVPSGFWFIAVWVGAGLVALLFRISVLGLPFSISYGQMTAALAISGFTVVNYFGLEYGKPIQNFLTTSSSSSLPSLSFSGFRSAAEAI